MSDSLPGPRWCGEMNGAGQGNPDPGPGVRANGHRLSSWARSALGALRGEQLFVLAIVVGVVLRLHQLGSQVIADDETHALVWLRGHPSYGSILVHLKSEDVCIPLTLFYKLAS